MTKENSHEINRNQTKENDHENNKGRIVSMSVITGIGLTLMLVASNSILLQESFGKLVDCDVLKMLQHDCDRNGPNPDVLKDMVPKVDICEFTSCINGAPFIQDKYGDPVDPTKGR